MRKKPGKPERCSHGVLGKSECRQRKAELNRKWTAANPEKVKVYKLVGNHPERYPLENECIFCGTTENLEHAHLDYEDDGFNYVTACGTCNRSMSHPSTRKGKRRGSSSTETESTPSSS